MGAMPAPRTEPGGDLVVSPGPGIPQGLVLPAADLVERFSRSSGPGGQGVNTTDSRAELRFDVVASTGCGSPRCCARPWRRRPRRGAGPSPPVGRSSDD